MAKTSESITTLVQQSLSLGATQNEVDDALEELKPREALLTLIASKQASKKKGALMRQALSLGSTDQEVDDAFDAPDPREALMALIRSKQPQPTPPPAIPKNGTVQNKDSGHSDVVLWSLDHKGVVAKMPNGDPVVIVDTTDAEHKAVWRGQEGWVKKHHIQVRADGYQRAAPASQFTDLGTFIPILQSAQVALAKPNELNKLANSGNPLIRRQDLLPSFFVDASMLDRDMVNQAIFICIEYCWLSIKHPDPDRYHLELLDACLSAFSTGSFTTAQSKYMDEHGIETTKEVLRNKGWCFGGADASVVGVFLDYVSLFQRPRNTSEERLFSQALKNMHLWYVHQRTMKWLFTATPRGIERGFHVRGWPTFTKAISELITPSSLLLSFSEEMRDKVLQASSPYMLGDYAQLTCDAMAVEGQRKPPMTPPIFNAVIEQKVFTSGRVDCDAVVKPLYARIYNEIASEFKLAGSA